jgi:AcrR family transcriptional regulator
MEVTRQRQTRPTRPSARARILAAAADIARDVGPANLSLDAVAARAGVSKGGLLYHFPAKVQLLQSLVEDHIERFTQDMKDIERDAEPSRANVLHAYLDVSMIECAQKAPPTAGVLAAIVQHPEMMIPIKRFKRTILDQLKAEAGDDSLALTLFLVLEGLRSMKLFDAEVLSRDETKSALDGLRMMIDGADRKAA